MRAVLVTIADAANADGEHAHPGMAAMVSGSLYSQRMVQTAVSKLVAERWLEIEDEGGGRGRATVYRVLMLTPEERVQPSRGLDDKPRDLERETPRSSDGVLISSTLSNVGRSRRKPETPFPEGRFMLTVEMRAWAKSNGFGHIDLRSETAMFKDHALANDRRARDWVAAWRTWIRRAAVYRPAPANGKTTTTPEVSYDPDAPSALSLS